MQRNPNSHQCLVSQVGAIKLPRYLGWMSGCLFFCLTLTNPALSQITPDDTLGSERSAVTPNVDVNGLPAELIEGGATRGVNLFHSFLNFNIGEGQRAYFANPAQVENILSRVTGNNLSNILGTLGVLGNANLFFINPNGILFGPNAQLDIQGSFIASTANSLVFDNGFEFSATNPAAPPLLTLSVPIGLQFGTSPGSIVNRSKLINNSTNALGEPVGLEVNPNRTLALVGSGVSLEDGNLTALAGRIELGSVASNSFVSLTPIQQGWALGYGAVENFQDIQLSQGAIVDTSGTGGTIRLQGRYVMVTGGSQISSAALGEGDGGALSITASESVELVGSFLATQVGINVGAPDIITGRGGNILIETKHLIIRDGGIISSGTISQGAAGNLTVNASESVELSGVGFFIPSLLTTATQGAGAGGDLTINTKRLVVRDGAEIQAATFGEGRGGNLTVNASESVQLIGTGIRGIDGTLLASGLFASSGIEGIPREFQPSGNGGNLRIDTGQLRVQDGAQVSVSSLGLGNAGNLEIMARSIELNQGKLIAETASTEGGNITLDVQDTLLLRNQSQISTTAGNKQNGGNGGNITIDAKFIIAPPSENSDITANAFTGNGGKVNIFAQGIFGIEFRPDLTDPQANSSNDITASSELGLQGTVSINQPDVTPQTGLVQLPEKVIDAEQLVVQGCQSGGKLAAGEFFITGRGGLPLNPIETVDIMTVLPDLGFPNTNISDQNYPARNQNQVQSSVMTQPSEESSQLIVEAQGWIKDANGKVVLTTQAPTATLHSPGLTPATCYGSATNSASSSYSTKLSTSDTGASQ